MWHGGQEIWSGSGSEFDDLFGTEYSVQVGHCPTVTVLPQRLLRRLGTSNFHVHSYGSSPCWLCILDNLIGGHLNLFSHLRGYVVTRIVIAAVAIS